MVRLDGDPDLILDAKVKYMDPVAEAPFREHGHRGQIVARNAEGIVVINIWDDAEGRDLANADSKMQQARSQILAATDATPHFANWEILDQTVT